MPAAAPIASFVRSAIPRAEIRPSQVTRGVAVLRQRRGGLCGFSASQWAKTTSRILQLLRSERLLSFSRRLPYSLVPYRPLARTAPKSSELSVSN